MFLYLLNEKALLCKPRPHLRNRAYDILTCAQSIESRAIYSDKSLGDKPGNEANTISRDPTIGIITCHQSTQWLRS